MELKEAKHIPDSCCRCRCHQGPEYKRWRAEKGREYYYLSEGGKVFMFPDRRTAEDDYTYSIGNYFETKEEAEHYEQVLLATQRLKDAAEGFEPSPGAYGYVIDYNAELRDFTVSDTWGTIAVGSIVYPSMETALKVIATMQRELDLVRAGDPLAELGDALEEAVESGKLANQTCQKYLDTLEDEISKNGKES